MSHTLEREMRGLGEKRERDGGGGERQNGRIEKTKRQKGK